MAFRQSTSHSQRSLLLIHQLFLLLFGVLVTSLQSEAAVTIDPLAQYSSQRSCGKGCVQNSYNNGPDYEGYSSCSSNKSCCALQSRATATSFILSCWSEACAATTESPLMPSDTSTALAVNDTYCSYAPATAITTGPSPTTYTLQTTTKPTVAAMVAAAESKTQVSNGLTITEMLQPSNSSSGRTLDTSDKIALGIGLPIGILTLVGTACTGYIQLRQYRVQLKELKNHRAWRFHFRGSQASQYYRSDQVSGGIGFAV